MNNRFSPAPDPVVVQPIAAIPGDPPPGHPQDADLVPLLLRFSAFALLGTFVFILLFRLIGFNSPKQPAAVAQSASEDSEPTQSAPSYVPPSSTSNSAPAPVRYSPSPVKTTSRGGAYDGFTGSKLLRLEDGRFNEAVRQWVGNDAPRAVINAPVNGTPSPAPVPQYLPSPTTLSSDQ